MSGTIIVTVIYLVEARRCLQVPSVLEQEHIVEAVELHPHKSVFITGSGSDVLVAGVWVRVVLSKI
jgi:hypothetical protein